MPLIVHRIFFSGIPHVRTFHSSHIHSFKLSKSFILSLALIVVSIVTAKSATLTSTSTGGNWETGSTWVNGTVPGIGDNVIIATTGTNSVLGNSNSYTCANLTINSAAKLIMQRAFSVTGTSTISGTISFGSTNTTTARSMVFTGAVTLNSGTVWDETNGGANTVQDTYSFGNSFTNNATTFTTLLGSQHTFTGTTMTLSGSTVTSIPLVAITGNYTNNGTLTVGTTLSGGGGLTNGTSGTLNLGGTSTITTFNASTTGNIVNYTGGAQQIDIPTSGIYHDLGISGSGIKTLYAGITTINGNLTLSGTAIITAVIGLTIGGDFILGSGISFKAGTFTHNLAGNWTNNGSIFTPGTSTINLNGNNSTSIYGSATTSFYNLTISKGSSATMVTNSNLINAFLVGGNLSVTQGNLVLQATNANYTVNGDLIVSASGTLTHSVNWDVIPPSLSTLLSVGGSISILGKYDYSGAGRSHVQMSGVNKTISTGTSSLCILTLVNTSGSITANGPVTIDNNFWASFGAGGGTFATSTYTVIAKSGLYNNGGTININGGTLNVTGGLHVGTSSLNGNFNLSSGTLISDFIYIGDGTRTGSFLHSGGINNLGDLIINPSCSYTCTNSPIINISGNWINNGTFTPNISTVNLNGTAQSISGATTFNNLTLAGSGTKTFANNATISGNFNINSGVIANLGTGLSHTSNSLFFGLVGQSSGSWGSTSSSASYKNDIYLASTTGIVNVATDSRSIPVFSGLTNQSNCFGTATVTLNGTISATGPIYPANGETIGININGVLQNTTISGATGGFSINYLSSTIPASTPYIITYYYGGNTLLKTANNTSSTFTVNPTTTISNQSTSGQTVNQGNAFSPITVTAAGAGLSYQWSSNTIQSISGGTSLGATNGAQTNSYSPQSTTAGNLFYYCIVSGTCGSATSAVSDVFIVNPSTTYPTAGTFSFTVPVGVTCLQVEAWGGGGKGGSTSNSPTDCGGGGGGAYSRGLVTVTPGTYTVIVGAGSATALSGGDSYFDNLTRLSAKGGSSVTNNNSSGASGGVAGNCIGDVRYSGGDGGDGSTNGGGGGSSAGTMSSGNTANNSTGAFAPIGGGNGGDGKSSSNGNGIAGLTPGGGGGVRSGYNGTYTGGSGADGQVIISWGTFMGTNAPVITTPIFGGDFSISGTSDPNANIVVYSGGTQIGTATATSSGVWIATVSVLAINQNITATARIIGNCLSEISNVVIVSPDSPYIITPGITTFTVPENVTQIQVEAWGGGGKGGSHNITNSIGLGGGGGGAYTRSLLTVKSGDVYNLSVGAGSSTTAAGSDSYFNSTIVLLAKGGNSVADDSATGGSGGASGVGDFKTSGGNGASGNYVTSPHYGGGGGSSASALLSGNNATNAIGATLIGGGSGGNGFSSTNTSGSGSPGLSLSGGGGGGLKYGTGNNTPIGGNGADGQIIISWASITTSPKSLSGFTYVEGSGPSTVFSFTVNVITNQNLLVTPPLTFEISTDNVNGFAIAPITLVPFGGVISKTIYVRLKSDLTVGTYGPQNITLTSTGFSSKKVTCSGSVTTSYKTVVVGYKSGIPQDNYYVINGTDRRYAGAKLLNPANFGGTNAPSPYNFVLYDFGTNPITEAGLIANGVQILDLGINTTDAGSGTTSSSYSTAELNAIKAWTIGTNNRVVLAFQGITTALGGSSYATDGIGNVNPNSVTDIGQSIMNGPFGTTNTYDQGGGYQGSYSAYPGTSCILTLSANGNPTGLVNTLTGDIYLADVGFVGITSGLTNGAGITSATDAFFANIYHCLARIVQYGPGVICDFFSCNAGINSVSLSTTTISIICPATNTDLNTLHSGSIPTGTSLVWFTNPDHTGTPYATPSTAVAGTYYAFYYDQSSDCYSPVSLPVLVESGITISTTTINEFSYVVTLGPSTINEIYVSGTCLNDNIKISTPPNFEISSDGANFQSTPITLLQVGGNINTNPVYVRLKSGLSIGSYSDNIVLTSQNAITKYVALLGSVIGQTVCGSSGTTANQTSITYVNFNTISNTSAKPSGYTTYYSAISTNLLIDNPYYLSVRLNTVTNRTVYCRAWIDWNGDGDFDETGESYDLGTVINNTNGLTTLSPLNILVPLNATIGYTRMRISCKNAAYPVQCETGFDGEVEDYKINIMKNFWRGNTSNDWGTPSNWTAGFVPITNDDVIFSTGTPYSPAVNTLVLDKNRTIGNLLNISTQNLEIPAGKGLFVNNSITTDNNPNKILIKSSATLPNGSMIFPNASDVYATVEMFSKAYWNKSLAQNSIYQWQYIGIPVQSVTASPTFDGSYVRQWNETEPDWTKHWIQQNNASILTPFTGYEICQAGQTTYQIQGLLVNSDFTTYSATSATPTVLPYHAGAAYPGQYIFANPYTAAIDINKLSFGTGTEKTVYLYNTGSNQNWLDKSGKATTGINPGQYTAVPFNLAGPLSNPSIPSMQGFLIKAMTDINGTVLANAFFSITYASVVTPNTSVLRAPSVEKAESPVYVYSKINVTGANSTDCMWIFTEPTCTHNFDNGWDGNKFMSSDHTAQLFAMEADGNYQVDAVNDINNTILGFQAGGDTNYTLTFTHENLKNNYAGMFLLDLANTNITDITESGSTYSFVADSTPTPVKRFIILTRKIDTESTENSTHLKVFNSGNTIFIQNLSNLNGEMVIYDIMGRYLKKALFTPYGVTAVQVATITGAYIVKAATNSESVSKKIVVGKD